MFVILKVSTFIIVATAATLLMITGNFAMLIGANPKEVHEWYLAVYADAYEWVEAPNVIGMSQFADGGLLGSKPYAAGGNYINKMSDYCRGCRYDVKQRSGPKDDGTDPHPCGVCHRRNSPTGGRCPDLCGAFVSRCLRALPMSLYRSAASFHVA